MANLSLYRGVCIENDDPLQQGRIRVQVPQAFGTSVSGWANPGWPVHDLTIWPIDRLPKIGQGVWVMFESWDNLAWIAVYGPVDPEVPDEPEMYVSTIAMELPAMPKDIEVSIPGILSSAAAGTPSPMPFVSFQRSTLGSSGPWVEVDRVPVDLGTGEWMGQYTRTDYVETAWYRAVFSGSDPYTAVQTDPAQPPIPTVPTNITWTADAIKWKTELNLTGTLRTTTDDKAVKNALVRIYEYRGTGNWLLVASARTTNSGIWTIPYTRPVPDALSLRAVYAGDGTYIYDEEAKTYPVLSIPVTTTMSLPPMDVAKPITVTGTTNTEYGPPYPNLTVDLEVRNPATTGTWVVKASGAAAPSANGAWSIPYVTEYGKADYRVSSRPTYVFQKGTSPVITRDIIRGTITSNPQIANAFYNGKARASGIVNEAERPTVGAVAGSVKLYMRRTGQTTWVDYTDAGTEQISASGSYAITSKTIPFDGLTEWKVEYLGDNNYYTASTSGISTANVPLGQVTGLTGDNSNHTTANFHWTAIPEVTGYGIERRIGNGAWTAIATTAAATTSYSNGGLANNTSYGYRVRAVRDAAYGPWSSTITLSTGRPELRNAGEFGKEMHPYATDSWRPLDGWSYVHADGVQGHVAQGYYSSTNGMYRGVMTYDGGAFRYWVAVNYGQQVLDHIAWNQDAWIAASVAMYRLGSYQDSGNWGNQTNLAVPPCFWVTGTVAGQGGQPALAGGAWSPTALTKNTAAYCALTYPHWAKHVLMNENLNGNGGVYVVNSLATYTGDPVYYARFNQGAAGGNVCNLAVHIRWNFVTQSYVAPAWS